MDTCLPLYFKTDRLRCLLIGGRKVATRKVDMLRAAGCSLTLIAPEIEKSIEAVAGRGLPCWHARKYADGDCEGLHFVIAATLPEETNRAVSFEAERLGIPANAVDVPDLCTVIFGASWQEGGLSVSVSTGGTAPFMAAVVRDHIAEALSGMGA
jgi:precorrin-2 dehydrogenase/sirohydrochlorin ferrochelatase